MASPQLKNGYTRIANELLEAISRTNLSSNENRVLIGTIRETYGYQEKAWPIASSRFSQLTGIQRRTVRRALKSLKRKNILSRLGIAKELGYKNTKGKRKFDPRTTVWSVQKDYHRWKGCEPLGGATDPQKGHDEEQVRVSIDPQVRGAIDPQVRGAIDPQLGAHKETERKVNKGGEMPPPNVSSSDCPRSEGTGHSEEKKKGRRDSRLDHPAIKIYRKFTHLWPKYAVRDKMIKCYREVGENRWREVIEEWIERGYNICNLKGIMDVARNGFRDDAEYSRRKTQEALAGIEDLGERYR